ncbi:scrFIAM [Symbiodinium necroappetens]|uniref:ScrFIAM protein n=1 Tax=Symbiodinium necroappetens TaxID=1628268 RepID=A0A813A7L2_9DINO|nr:scrFIAM [Symbiodinium necroappetens]
MSVPEAGQWDTFAAKRLLAPGPAVGPGPQGGSLQRAVRLDPAPNRLRLVPERLERSLLDRYKCRRRQHHINKAAAQLWAQGVEFQRALKIVQEAFDEATYE